MFYTIYLRLANGQKRASGNFPSMASSPALLEALNLALVLVEIYCPNALGHPG